VALWFLLCICSYQAGDYSGSVVSEALQQRPVRPAFTPIFPNAWVKEEPGAASLTRKERRQYKKRRHKSSSKSTHNAGTGGSAPLLHYPNAQVLKQIPSPINPLKNRRRLCGIL
jgi:hypothetical protein